MLKKNYDTSKIGKEYYFRHKTQFKSAAWGKKRKKMSKVHKYNHYKSADMSME